METEVWKPVVGYEGLYEVSNLGRVKSLRYCKEKILKISRNKFYKNIILKINWLRKNFLVHRLVALHFIDNLDNLSCVLHKKEDLDGNGFLYNWADNLYWWTQKDNMQDCFKKWRWNNHFKLNHPTKWKFWKDNHNSKKINQYTKIIWNDILRKKLTSLFNKQKIAPILNDAKQQKQYIEICSPKPKRNNETNFINNK